MWWTRTADETCRRVLDLVIASCGLIVLSPLLLIVALLIKLDSPGPVLFRGERVGRYGEHFLLYKFRSMTADAALQGPGITVAKDPRLTSVGQFLRRAKLDELPQLINVLRGDMSMVGPRPEDPRYVALYSAEQRQVLNVRPGITSPASIRFRHEEDMLQGADWEQVYRNEVLESKLQIELEYLKCRSVWRDLGVVAQTVISLARDMGGTDNPCPT